MDREASRWRASRSSSWVLDLQEPGPHSDSMGQISWKMRPVPRGPPHAQPRFPSGSMQRGFYLEKGRETCLGTRWDLREPLQEGCWKSLLSPWTRVSRARHLAARTVWRG